MALFRLHRYILKEHLGPFLFTLFIFMFLFIVKFLLQYSDRLFGKGLPFLVIIEFVFVNLAWMIALTVPMSVLVSTLMAFGRMSADNEIIALKSSGITIYKLITAPLLFSALIAIAMVWFNDQILPELNHRSRIMLNEVTRKKPTLSIEPGIFVKMNHGRTHLLVENVVRDGKDSLAENESFLGPQYSEQRDRLENISIFTTESNQPMRTITAKYGYLEFDEPNARIIITLHEGELHEKRRKEEEQYTRSKFKKNIFYVPAKEFTLDQSTKSDYRTDREMGIGMMNKKIDEYVEQEEKFRKDLANSAQKIMESAIKKRERIVSESTWKRAAQRAKSNIQSTLSNIKYYKSEIKRKQERQLQLEVEVYKKYSIPFACLVFILVGAPLGIMAKKGGLGIGFSLSVSFFLIYWISLILGEGLADRGIISPFWAMWGSNIIIGIFGIYLVFKAVKESKFINWDLLTTFIKKFKKTKEQDAIQN